MTFSESLPLILLCLNLLGLLWTASKIVFTVEVQKKLLEALTESQKLQDEKIESHNTRISHIEGHLGLQ